MNNSPQNPLNDLVGVLLRVNSEARLWDTLHKEGVSDAYIHAVRSGLKLMSIQDVAEIERRYNIKIPEDFMSEIHRQDSGHEVLPGATREEVESVLMQDIVGAYEIPEEVAEWSWIEKNASYAHVKNGQSGIWEFILNLNMRWDDIPEKLVPVIANARQNAKTFLIFHQGT